MKLRIQPKSQRWFTSANSHPPAINPSTALRRRLVSIHLAARNPPEHNTVNWDYQRVLSMRLWMVFTKTSFTMNRTSSCLASFHGNDVHGQVYWPDVWPCNPGSIPALVNQIRLVSNLPALRQFSDRNLPPTGVMTQKPLTRSHCSTFQRLVSKFFFYFHDTNYCVAIIRPITFGQGQIRKFLKVGSIFLKATSTQL